MYHSKTVRSKFINILLLGSSSILSCFLIVNTTCAEEIDPENITVDLSQSPQSQSVPGLSQVPVQIPAASEDGRIYFTDTSGLPKRTTLNSQLQINLTKFINDSGRPIAAAVVVEVATGRILAMAQGRMPQYWGATQHTAIHNQFPAASLFKTVASAAMIDLLDSDTDEEVGLNDSCGNVHERGSWINDHLSFRAQPFNLRRAFGLSCNSFFAKIAINKLGVGVINFYAQKLGWKQNIAKDFGYTPSDFFPPNIANANTQTVGKYAAGFGNVGISAVHAAWISLTLSRDGIAIPLKIFEDTDVEQPGLEEAPRVLSVEASRKIRDIMKSTVLRGTASHTFAQPRYHYLRQLAAGKTGTLNGKSPAGLTTLFTGMMPVENPEIAVAAIVMVQGNSVLKASHLAAETFNLYDQEKNPDHKQMHEAQHKKNSLKNKLKKLAKRFY